MDALRDGSRDSRKASERLLEQFQPLLDALHEFFTHTLKLKINRLDGSDGRDIRVEIQRCFYSLLKYTVSAKRWQGFAEQFQEKINKGKLEKWPEELRELAQFLHPANLKQFLQTVLCLVAGYTSSGKTSVVKSLAQAAFGISTLPLPIAEEETTNVLVELHFIRSNTLRIQPQGINRDKQYINLFNLLNAKPTWGEFKRKFERQLNNRLIKQGHTEKEIKPWLETLLALYYLAQIDPVTQSAHVFDTEREKMTQTRERLTCLQNLARIVLNIYSPEVRTSGLAVVPYFLDIPGPGNKEITRHNNFFIELGKFGCELLVVVAPNDMLCNKLETYKTFIDAKRHEAVANSLRQGCYWAPWMYLVFSKYLSYDPARKEIDKLSCTHYFNTLEDAGNYIPTRFHYHDPDDPDSFFDGRQRTLLLLAPDCEQAEVPEGIVNELLAEIKDSEPTPAVPPLSEPSGAKGESHLPPALKVWGKIPRRVFIQDQVKLLLKYDVRTARETTCRPDEVPQLTDEQLYNLFVRYLLGIRQGKEESTDQFVEEGADQFIEEEPDQFVEEEESGYRYCREYNRGPKVLLGMLQEGAEQLQAKKVRVLQLLLEQYMRPFLASVVQRFLAHQAKECRDPFFRDLKRLIEEKRKLKEDGDIFDLLPSEAEINKFFIRRHFKSLKEVIIDLLSRAFDETMKASGLQENRRLQGRYDTIEYLRLYWKIVEKMEERERQELERRLNLPFSMIREMRLGIMGIVDHLYRMMAATSPMAKTAYLDGLMQRHNGLSGLLDLDWPGMDRYVKDVGIPESATRLLRVAAAVRECCPVQPSAAFFK